MTRVTRQEFAALIEARLKDIRVIVKTTRRFKYAVEAFASSLELAEEKIHEYMPDDAEWNATSDEQVNAAMESLETNRQLIGQVRALLESLEKNTLPDLVRSAKTAAELPEWPH